MGKFSEFVFSIVLGVIVAFIAKSMDVSSGVQSGLMVLTVIVTSQIFKIFRKCSAVKEKK